MASFNFNKWNNILGWFAFAIALITYSLTVEPTLSFWDCGEYISTAAKLQIGHPPGAPLFQMIGAFFAMFAFSPDKIALMVNMMSVFSSAFTILFLFWSLTILLKKIIPTSLEQDNGNSIMVLGSALIASLAFTYTDSFWYNATEAEVYAMASLFIALLLWLGSRWEQEMDSPRGNRWLVLISLVIGLSFGAHFMALLTIPSIGLLYYFKKYKEITLKNFIVANVVVVVILFFVFKFLLPYTLSFFGKTEIFMVNTFGLPFNSGTIFAFLLIVGFFYFGLNYTRKKGQVFYNTILLCLLFILIGFSTWIMLPIRANTDIPINENKPSDAAEVLAYYNREQYGEQKTFYGPMFSEAFAGIDENNPYFDEKPNYERDYKTGQYIITNDYKNGNQNLDDNHKGFMPRMWSTDRAENYMSFTEPLDFRINPAYSHEDELVQVVSEFRNAYNQGAVDLDDYTSFLKKYGDYLIIEKPSFVNNMKFMFEYQFGYMYVRYLMWNFVGRQNDVQGKYDGENGNWISGIKPLDELRLGNQSELTSDMKNNKARNTYYFLPFILGLIGMIFHAKKDLKSFYVLLALFLFTSFALKIFLNERPFEPRERDYAVVGSFYVFAMWMGYGVFGIFEGIKKHLSPRVAVPVVLAVTFLAGPALLAKENWDDHDRSGKYTALAMAKAYLDSCEPNAILFTIGDNDTFPLWYAQEIEGYRTDVRIINTSLLATDWYIDQMKNKSYNSEPVPISFTRDQYRGSNRDGVLFIEKTTEPLLLDDILTFIKIEDERATVEMNSGKRLHYYPSNKIIIPIDKEIIIQNKVVSKQFQDSIVSQISLTIKGQALYKNRLIMLDILNQNNWERPLYFTGGSFDDADFLWLKDYLQLDGMCYKIVPIKTPKEKDGSPLDMGIIDSDKMYNIIMKWDWGNSGNPKMYHDIETRRNSVSYRSNIARLMETLINEGKVTKAEKLIDLTMQKMPIDIFGYYTLVEPFVEGYYALNKKDKAQKIISKLLVKYQESLRYYNSLTINEQNSRAGDLITDIERYRSLLEISKKAKDTLFFETEKVKFNNYNKMYSRFKRDMIK
ncbi:DUF2723 domain-containing protein [uncultured Flavobacterium sp.]|uniref:glycosyltransferase family 117 protein n=1 Tax=uncultured Flavobacterium sp. TaxID=165435 RepID=UPI0030CA5881